MSLCFINQNLKWSIEIEAPCLKVLDCSPALFANKRMTNLLAARSHLRGIGKLGKRQAFDHMYTVYYLYFGAFPVIFIGRSVLLNEIFIFFRSPLTCSTWCCFLFYLQALEALILGAASSFGSMLLPRLKWNIPLKSLPILLLGCRRRPLRR